MTFAIASVIRIVEKMTTLKSLLASNLVCCAFLLMTAHASAQDTKTRRTVVGSSAVSIVSYKEIPAATEPCTSEECDWWNRMREAGNKLLGKPDQKSLSAYASLFVEGTEKSYKVPLADRPSQILFSRQPVLPPKPPSQQQNETVKLSVEYRSDGSVGEIKVLNGLGTQFAQRCIRAAGSVVFLPAVKDRQFVTEWQTPEYKFAYVAARRN